MHQLKNFLTWELSYLESQLEINFTREMMLRVTVLPFYLVLLKAVKINSSETRGGIVRDQFCIN